MDSKQPDVIIRGTDMEDPLKSEAIRICSDAISSEESESKVASQIKKKLDDLYPRTKWHCLVGRAYGSYFTHDPGSFLHLSVGKEVIIIFRAS